MTNRRNNMKLEINKIVTLGNNEEYLIVDKVIKDEKEYYYIAQVNDDETDIKDNLVKIFERSNSNKTGQETQHP